MLNRVERLVRHFRAVSAERMQDLPICNPALDVEAVSFTPFGKHHIGVLITPWFMNLILLPGDDRWNQAGDGERDDVPLPAESCEFTVCRDAALGTYLSAVLFRAVGDFPDQDMAVAVARETLRRLLAPEEREDGKRRISRRDLLRGLGTG